MDANACPVDGAVLADPFAGVWTGSQGNESWTVTYKGGCTTWVGVVSGTTCDYCAGSYSATTGASTIVCENRNNCGSPNHTDVGTVSVSECSILYAYNFGGGTSSWNGMRVGDATGDVCAIVDGGAGN